MKLYISLDHQDTWRSSSLELKSLKTNNLLDIIASMLLVGAYPACVPCWALSLCLYGVLPMTWFKALCKDILLPCPKQALVLARCTCSALALGPNFCSLLLALKGINTIYMVQSVLYNLSLCCLSSYFEFSPLGPLCVVQDLGCSNHSNEGNPLWHNSLS